MDVLTVWLEVFASGTLSHDLLNYLFTHASYSKEWHVVSWEVTTKKSKYRPLYVYTVLCCLIEENVLCFVWINTKSNCCQTFFFSY